jgi:TolB-like protein/class 3 adenylate cyclase
MSDTRRLAAILAADVVGYSKLMSTDEAGTARAVREHRAAAVPIVRSFGGRLVKTMGDGVLLEFPSVVAAAGCAIAMQKQMVARNAESPSARQIRYRVGVNLGDIIVDGDDILGDGVNVAARLEGICEPGGVCVSGAAYEQFRGRIEADFVDLGEQELKNISRPVRAFGLTPQGVADAPDPSPPPLQSEASIPYIPLLRRWTAVVAVAVFVATFGAIGVRWWMGGLAFLARTPPVVDKLVAAPRLSIAVLPFANLSSDSEQDYFADAITDDLTTDLSHLDGSFVIAHNTALTYKGKSVDIKQVGQELGVRYALEGSVRRNGDDISFNVQLISTDTGAHAWADRFEGKRGDLGMLQVDAVARIANSLGVELVRAEALRANHNRNENSDAADLAMQGWAELYKGLSPSTNEVAANYFQRALNLDPSLPRGRIGLAMTLIHNVLDFRQGNQVRDLDRAETLIDKVLADSPDNLSGHVAKAWLLSGQHRYASLSLETERILEIDPNSVQAYSLSGFALLFSGHAAEALPRYENALRLSPRDPLRHLFEFQICHAYDHLADWEKGADWCRRSIADNKSFFWSWACLAAAEGWLGHENPANAAVAGLLKLKPGFTVSDWMGFKFSDDPTFKSEYARIAEGLRKAGLPEGPAKSN